MSGAGPTAAEAGALATARLTASASTAVFRALLDAIARPGLVVTPVTAAPASVPPALLPVLALADLDVCVAILGHDVDGGDDRWSEVIASVTGARITSELDDADVVVALRPPMPAEVARLRRGDAFGPELGARLVVSCRALGEGGHDEDDDGDMMTLALDGPGTGRGRRVAVAGIDVAVIAALAERNRRFPAGVDTWLVGADGAMVGLPRSVTVCATNGEAEHDG